MGPFSTWHLLRSKLASEALPANAVQMIPFWSTSIPRGATIPADRPHEQHVRLPFPLAPGDEVVLPLLLSSDGLADGDYDIVLSPVHESVAWFVDAGVTPLRVPVRVGSDK